jgi:hypothetical protein
MTIAKLMETHRDVYAQAVVEGSGMTSSGVYAATAAAWGVEQMRANLVVLRERAVAAAGRADADGAALTDLFLYLAANAHERAANVLMSATHRLATGVGCAAEATVYEAAAIRTLSEPAADAIEHTMTEARAGIADARAGHAADIERALADVDQEVERLARAIDSARNVEDLDNDHHVLAVRREMYEAALSVREVRARLRSARLAAELAAAEAEASTYALAQFELATTIHPWMDIADDDADL